MSGDLWYAVGSTALSCVGPQEELLRPVIVERSTPDSVWIDGRRVKRLSGYESYFPTRSEARAFLIADAQREIERGERRLASHRHRLDCYLAIPE